MVGSCPIFEWTHNIAVKDDKDDTEKDELPLDAEDFGEHREEIDPMPVNVFFNKADGDGPEVDHMDEASMGLNKQPTQLIWPMSG